MSDAAFSHVIFWQHPLSSLCFFSFAMSILSLWVKKTPWLWGSFAALAYALAFQANITTAVSVIPIALLFLCHGLLKSDIQKAGRLFLFVLATALSSALFFHMLPGFHNWRIADAFQLSPDAFPTTLWLNFDKPFIGLIPLALSIPLLRTRAQVRAVAKIALPFTLLGIFVILGLSLMLRLVTWDPKIPTIFFLWFFNNFIFVTIAEEAFFRGFFQKEIGRWLGTGTWASVGAIIATSVLFTLFHVKWAPGLPMLGIVFLSSILYGIIYEATQSIEASIFCHFLLNLTHFLLFTYPALSNGVIAGMSG
jgi:membrane protease YdiL (CAAX protease family)